MASTVRAASQNTGKPALYREFWAQFLDRVRVEHPEWTRARKPGTDNWLAMPSPLRSDGSYSVSFCKGYQLRSELCLDTVDPARVAALFGALHARRDEIEQRFGGSLTWEELPTHRASRIADHTDGDVTDPDRYDEYITWFIASQERLRSAIAPVIDEARGTDPADS